MDRVRLKTVFQTPEKIEFVQLARRNGSKSLCYRDQFFETGQIICGNFTPGFSRNESSEPAGTSRHLAEEAEIVGFLDRLWKAISEVEFSDMPGSVADPEDARKRAQAIAPVVWLLGKTGAGKTAIVAALTGDQYAQVGEGFEPCTRTAGFYDVPPEVPLLRFLDTRGLGEAGYDPTKDIAWCEGQSHLLLVAMQVADPVQHTVLRVLRLARRRHPDWPVVVAQTGLHRLYPVGTGHPKPYPYTGGLDDETHAPLPHGRHLLTSADCSTGCPGRRRASYRSTLPSRKTDFRLTTMGSRGFGSPSRKPGPEHLRRCTSHGLTPRATG
jgi:hypothetical protein